MKSDTPRTAAMTFDEWWAANGRSSFEPGTPPYETAFELARAAWFAAAAAYNPDRQAVVIDADLAIELLEWFGKFSRSPILHDQGLPERFADALKKVSNDYLKDYFQYAVKLKMDNGTGSEPIMSVFDVMKEYDSLIRWRDLESVLKELERRIRNDECDQIANGFRATGRQSLHDYLDKRVRKRNAKT